jgi:hypothetical protein
VQCLVQFMVHFLEAELKFVSPWYLYWWQDELNVSLRTHRLIQGDKSCSVVV